MLELCEEGLDVVYARFAATEKTVHAVAGIAVAKEVDKADDGNRGAGDGSDPDPGLSCFLFRSMVGHESSASGLDFEDLFAFVILVESAEYALDKRYQLKGVEGLGEIGAHAGRPPTEDIGVLGLGGEHDDGDLPGLGIGLEALEDLEAVHPGHHDVEDDQVGLVGFDFLEGFGAVEGGRHLVAGTLEVDLDEADNVPLVVHRQNLLALCHIANLPLASSAPLLTCFWWRTV